MVILSKLDKSCNAFRGQSSFPASREENSSRDSYSASGNFTGTSVTEFEIRKGWFWDRVSSSGWPMRRGTTV